MSLIIQYNTIEHACVYLSVIRLSILIETFIKYFIIIIIIVTIIIISGM